MLTEELVQQGNWLFRYRSYVPLLLVPFGLLVLTTHLQPWPYSIYLLRMLELCCLGVSFVGVLVRILAIGWAQSGTSGRNTKEQIAENLNTTGIYSVCRHPLYLGNILMVFGTLLFTRSLWFPIAGLLFYVLLYERIAIAEERFLEPKFGEAYRRWASRTPAFIPKLSLWEHPQHKFSFRAALKGEFYGVTALFVIFLALKTFDIRFSEQVWRVDLFWAYPTAVMILLFIILRHLRKHTKFFEKTTSK